MKSLLIEEIKLGIILFLFFCSCTNDHASNKKQSLYNQSVQKYTPTSPFQSNQLYPVLKKEINECISIAPEYDSMGVVASLFAWDWSYYALASINGYKATGDTAYLNLVTDSYNVILDYRDSELGRQDCFVGKELPSWGHRKEQDPCWWNEVTFPGRITLPIALFLVEVQKNDSLCIIYRQQYEKFLISIEQAVGAAINFYNLTKNQEGYFTCNICDIGEGLPEAFNHSHSLGTSMVVLYELTGNKQYERITKEMLKYFLQQVKRKQGQLVWPYYPVCKERPADNLVPEFSRKAAVTMLFPFYSNKYGVVVSDSLMQCFADVFKKSVCQKNGIMPTIDPDPSTTKNQPENLISADFMSFSYLMEFDTSIYKTIDREIALNTTGFYKNGWFSDRLTILAYSYKGLIGK